MDEITNEIRGVRADISGLFHIACAVAVVFGGMKVYEHYYPPVKPALTQTCSHTRDYSGASGNYNERVVCTPFEEMK